VQAGFHKIGSGQIPERDAKRKKIDNLLFHDEVPEGKMFIPDLERTLRAPDESNRIQIRPEEVQQR